MKRILLYVFCIVASFCYAQTTQFYGPTHSGGIYGGGTIYSVDGSGNNYQKRLDLAYNTAVSGFCEGTNGKMYGAGGAAGSFVDGAGTIYEYDVINNVMYEKYTFPGGQGGPSAPMTLAPNNKMYGVCSSYGTYGQGFIFEYDYTNNIVTIKYHFDGPVNGGQPNTQLVLASNGKMYGATSAGANVPNAGSMFEFDYVNNIFTKKRDFDWNTIGAQPGPWMAQGTNQKIYGHMGNTSPQAGAIFEYDIALDTIIKVHTFNTTSSGGVGVIHTHGKIYGATTSSGAFGQGNIYEWNYNTGTYTSLWDFNPASGMYTSAPPLCINNKLYCINPGGGTFNFGTFVSYDLTSSTQTVLYNFNNPGPIAPVSGIVHSNGKIYGRGQSGSFNFGTLFKTDTVGSVTKLLDMAYSSAGNYPNDLAYIYGNLYATTYVGGTYDAGTIYKFDPALQQYTKLWEFDKFGNGNYPKGTLIPSSGTSVYGITEGGGAGDYGQVYEFDLNAQTYTPIYDLDDNTTGSYPTGYMVKHGNGKLYATTQEGGVNGNGTIVEVDPIGFTGVKRYDFANPANGQNADGIVLGANGKIYGVASKAGTNSNGTFYEFTPPTTFTKKFDFNASTKGDFPIGKPLEVAPGIFYGVTMNGGANGQGVLYKYKVSSNTFTKLVDFDSLDLNKGCRPNASLALGAGGKIYGTNTRGGAYNFGIMFEYDTLSGALTKKVDFNGTNGRWPGGLTLVCGTTLYDAGTSANFCKNSHIVLGTTPDPGYSYSWLPNTGLSSPSVPNPTLTVQTNPITYTVTETYLGCVSNDMITVTPLLPQTPQICLVTDDSADVYNHVIWEKSLYSGVDSFIVYRETSTNTYTRIGAVSVDSLSDYTDTARSIGPSNGNPQITTYRYKLSIKDTCGNEGALSPSHTTIFFSDLHNGQFTWNTYSVSNMTVTPITTFDLLRDSNNTGYWKVIGTSAGTSNILADPQYSTFQNVANWRVQANGITCNPTAREVGNSVQGTVVRSKSNITNNRTTGTATSTGKTKLGIFPNPSSGKLSIEAGEEIGSILIYNSLGTLVYETSARGMHTDLDISGLPAGVYTLFVKGKYTKVVKE